MSWHSVTDEGYRVKHALLFKVCSFHIMELAIDNSRYEISQAGAAKVDHVQGKIQSLLPKMQHQVVAEATIDDIVECEKRKQGKEECRNSRASHQEAYFLVRHLNHDVPEGFREPKTGSSTSDEPLLA